MAQYDYDLFVIGGGSGGVRAARMTANLGHRVALAEESRMGGTCVIRGCIPKKMLVYASHFAEDFELAKGFGWSVGETSFDWPTLIANKNKEIARLEGIYLKAVEGAGATVYHERATLRDSHTITLSGGRTLTADKILIATGGHPTRELIVSPGAELCITSNEAFELKELPKHIVIAGGGFIAVEFAHIFHGLGAEVTLVYRGPKVLRGFDEDLRDCLHASMARRGIRVLTNTIFALVEKCDGRLRARTVSGEEIVADQVMLAVGRVPNTTGLGLERAGVTLGIRGRVEVGSLFAHRGREHLRRRRCHRSHCVDARRHPRSDGIRENRVRERADPRGPHACSCRGVLDPRDRHGWSHRSGRAATRAQHRRLQIRLPSIANHAVRDRRSDAFEARCRSKNR